MTLTTERPAEQAVEGTGVSLELLHEVEQTLYREARILDEERMEDWLGILTEDIHYFMPAAEARYRNDPTDLHDPRRMAWFNDDLETLTVRVGRLLTGLAWGEDPPTRYTHLITNIEVELTERPDEYRVLSNFLVYRNRNEKDHDTVIGRREDVWRRCDGRLLLAKRLIRPTWNVLLSKNLNVFL